MAYGRQPHRTAPSHLNQFQQHAPGTDSWYQSLRWVEESLLSMSVDDFYAQQQTSSFQDLLCLAEWIRSVCPECPRDKGWLVEQLWRFGQARQPSNVRTADPWLTYHEAKNRHQQALSDWAAVRHDGIACTHVRRAALAVVISSHCVSSLAWKLGVKPAKEEKAFSIFEIRGDFRRFGGGRRRR